MLVRVIKRTTKDFQQKRFIGSDWKVSVSRRLRSIEISYEGLATHEKNNNEGNFVEAEYGNTFAVERVSSREDRRRTNGS